MQNDAKKLADVTTGTVNRTAVITAIVAVALLFGIGLASQMNGLMLAAIIAVAAAGFAVMLWPPSKDEQEAITWWNGLTKSEREKWLAQSRTGTHRDAWEAYKNSDRNH